MHCGSTDSTLQEVGVPDQLVSGSDRLFDIRQCDNCGLAIPTTNLKKEQLVASYRGYYTQDSSRIFTRIPLFLKLNRFYRGWLGTDGERNGLIASFSIMLFRLPGVGFLLKRSIRFLPQGFGLKNRKLLDVGCGSGGFLYRMKLVDIDASGIDSDDLAIEQARLFGIKASVKNLSELRSEKFDYITLNHVIEHVPEYQQLVSHIYEKLAVGGTLFLATPNYDSAGRLVFGKNWKGMDMPRHTQLFNREVLQATLKDAGFNDVHFYKDYLQSLTTILNSYKISGRSTLNPITIMKLVLRGALLSRRLDVLVCVARKRP